MPRTPLNAAPRLGPLSEPGRCFFLRRSRAEPRRDRIATNRDLSQHVRSRFAALSFRPLRRLVSGLGVEVCDSLGADLVPRTPCPGLRPKWCMLPCALERGRPTPPMENLMSIRSTIAITAIAAVSVLGLSACASDTDPSASASETPSVAPSVEPSVAPSVEPSVAPSVEPSVAPSVEPSPSASV